MKLNILAFGITKDIVGGSSVEVELSEGLSVGEFKTVLGDRYPAMKELKSLLVAVNEEYGDDQLILTEKDEIALIPPVSGG